MPGNQDLPTRNVAAIPSPHAGGERTAVGLKRVERKGGEQGFQLGQLKVPAQLVEYHSAAPQKVEPHGDIHFFALKSDGWPYLKL